MKKILMFFTAIILTLLSLITITSCGNNIKLPETKSEKVKYAFNGVESSLRNSSRLSSYNSLNDSTAKIMNKVSDNDISTIYNNITVEKETSNPQFQYDEPPMIQFQYMKALYEEVGEDFSFGTKYSYTMTGSIYYDFETRTSTENDKFLNQYTMVLSLIIDIDNNDLITAEVGFDMTYVNGNQIHKQDRYSYLSLDYDMNDTSPTYNLTMIDIDDLLAYTNDNEKYISAEYDYVNVEKNVIKEWRKFGVCSPEELSNYQSSDFIYKYSVLRAYKDNKIYRIENSFNKDKKLKTAVIEGLGFVSKLDAKDNFLNKASTDNSKIQTVVNKFNSILGKDIVNSFVYTGATEKWEGAQDSTPHNQFISIRDRFDGEVTGMQFSNDFIFKNIFDNYHINLYQDNYELLEEYNNLDEFNIYVKFYGKEYLVNKNDSFVDFLEENYKGIYENGWINFDIIIEITYKEKQLQCSLQCDFMNENLIKSACMNFTKVKAYLNNNMVTEINIPDFISNSAYYTVRFENNNQNTKALKAYIYANNATEANKNNYIDILKNNGFTEKTEFISYYNYYVKRIDNNYKLKVNVNYDGKGTDEPCVIITCELIEDKLPDKTISEYITDFYSNENIEIPEYNEKNYHIEETPAPNRILIDDAKEKVYKDYIKSFEDKGFTVYEAYDEVIAFKYIDGILYKIQTQNTSLIFTKTPLVLSFVGSMNGWNVENKDYEFDAIAEDNIIKFTYDITLNENDTFKVVFNHDWAVGEYNYNNINFDNSDPHTGKPIDDVNYHLYFESESEYNNIKALKTAKFRVTLTLQMNFSGYEYETVSPEYIKFKLLQE